MIRAMIFDLDGTLVKTERLKALSYAHATVELCPHDVTEDEVIEFFKTVVGLSRDEVALRLIDHFRLEDKLIPRMKEFGLNTPWQTFVQIRLRYYDKLIADPDFIRNNQWEHNVHLLHLARQKSCATALATMSHYEQAKRILDIIGLTNEFNFIATPDDVTNGKPDPEIYQLVLKHLGTSPEKALVIEDSPSGVKAALAAGTHVIAVTTPFTREQMHEAHLLADEWIIDDPTLLLAAVNKYTEIN